MLAWNTGERGLSELIIWGLCREGLFGVCNPGRIFYVINWCVLDDAQSVISY